MFCKGKSVQAASFHIYLQVELSNSGLSFTELEKKKEKKKKGKKVCETQNRCIAYFI